MALNMNGIFNETEAGGASIVQGEPTPPAKMDLDGVRQYFETFDAEFDAIEKKARDLVVDSDKAEAVAVEMAGQATKFKKRLELKRKEIIETPDGFVRGVNSTVKPVRDRVEKILNLIKREKIGPYQHKKEIARRAAEKAAQDAAREAQRKLDEQAAAAGVDSVKIETPVVPVSKAPTRTETATASSRMEWTFEVKDPAKVPENYKVIDEAKIRAALKAGIREIPGVNIFEKPVVSIRSN